MSTSVCSATYAAADRITSGSWPKSCSATGFSSGTVRSISVHVFSLRWWMPKLDTISETTSPAP
jgi:hypothetical protein